MIDQDRHPIEGATITYWIAQNVGGSTAKQQTSSDSTGAFHIDGVHGLGLSVEASEPGYQKLKDSQGTFGYATGTEGGWCAGCTQTIGGFDLEKGGRSSTIF